ncbi:MAG: hypothetical protein M3Z26_17140 [Bacteroidota bacterium]|nr:hypothetical protein [Bacteroidota bacterium]
MGKEQTKDLVKFLKTFDKEIIDVVMWLRDFAWDLCPQANELMYDNYNAVSLGWSLTDKVGHNICSVVIYRANQNVHFGFYWGNELSDPGKILLGEGKQYRYILVPDKKKFPKAYMKKLINESYANSLSKVNDQKQMIHGQTIVKSISKKKRDLTKPKKIIK